MADSSISGSFSVPPQDVLLPQGSWPPPLAHCGDPLVQPTDEWVTVGEVTSEPANGYKGNRFLYTALVPSDEVSAALTADGGIRNDVSGGGFQRTFAPNGQYSPQFWIGGPDGKRYESLIHSWDNHRQLILLPDDAFLMAYRLAPRILSDGSIRWDDLDRPVYDVVRVSPLSNYAGADGYSTARTTIRRDYLEDYLSRKNCVAVGTYFDERYSLDEPEVGKLIQQSGFSVKQPGRQLWFKRMHLDFANQISQVSACAILMIPKGEPISSPIEEDLRWPDRATPVKGRGKGTFGTMERAYVRDEVLREYEQRPEFDISPETGSVSYENRWGVGFIHRRGRNHLELELRKLYEGAQFEVIRHFHAFAVPATAVAADRKVHGDRNIGVRAKELVAAYLELTDTLALVSDSLGLVFTAKDIGQFASAEVKYQGWWRLPEFRGLGNVALETMPISDLLDRSKEIFNLLQRWQKAPLLQVAVTLGLKKADVKDLQSLRLVATICQLAQIAVDSGLDLIVDKDSLVLQWDPKVELSPLKPLFKLNGLRIADAHSLGSTISSDLQQALNAFGIDTNQYVSGWGCALDKIYDTVIGSLTDLRKLIVASLSESL